MAPEVCVCGGWVPLPRDPEAGEWGRRREPEPGPPLGLDWLEWCCLIVWGSLLYSVAKVLARLLTRMLVTKSCLSSPAPSSWTALALLPTCPAPALSMPPVCYDWEKPAAATAMVLPGSSGSADSNWPRNDEQCGDYKAAKKCFDSLLRDAAWTCDEKEDDYKAAMKCFDSLVRDAARICFVWSYDDAIPLTRQSDDPPPT